MRVKLVVSPFSSTKIEESSEEESEGPEYGFGQAKHFMPLPNTVVGSHCAWEIRLNALEGRIPGEMFVCKIPKSWHWLIAKLKYITNEKIQCVCCLLAAFWLRQELRVSVCPSVHLSVQDKFV